jgi:hypothetical protein
LEIPRIIPGVSALTLGQTARSNAMPELSISTEQVGFLIAKARQLDVKEGVSDPDEGSNGADDGMTDVLQDDGNDAVAQEISGFVNAMSVDEQVDLIALFRLGRGDGSADEWDDIRAEAARDHDRHVARYLLGQPMLGDLLEQGLDELGLSADGERITPVS